VALYTEWVIGIFKGKTVNSDWRN